METLTKCGDELKRRYFVPDSEVETNCGDELGFPPCELFQLIRIRTVFFHCIFHFSLHRLSTVLSNAQTMAPITFQTFLSYKNNYN